MKRSHHDHGHHHEHELHCAADPQHGLLHAPPHDVLRQQPHAHAFPQLPGVLAPLCSSAFLRHAPSLDPAKRRRRRSPSPAAASLSPPAAPSDTFDPAPLSRYLAILPHADLVAIVARLASDAALRPAVTACVPPPTVPVVERHLAALLAKLDASLPYSRAPAPVYSPYAYNRVLPILRDFADSLHDFIAYFSGSLSATSAPSTSTSTSTSTSASTSTSTSTSTSSPSSSSSSASTSKALKSAAPRPQESLFAFFGAASTATARLPDWDAPEHNELKLRLLAQLRKSWGAAIGALLRAVYFEGARFPADKIAAWASILEQANRDNHGAFETLVVEFSRLLPLARSATRGSSSSSSTGIRSTSVGVSVNVNAPFHL